MKYYNYIIAFFILLFVYSCAKQGAPLGGPQDEDAPKLLKIYPENESLNTNPTVIILEFDEYVKVETPNKQIIITPRINKDEIEVVANKNRVTINLNQDLEDSTTYVFNFQKSIKDITEDNVPENLSLVFSTGSYIDSLKFSGNVAFILPQRDKNITDVLVGLYAVEDTTNVLTSPPYYIGQADSVGNFGLTNIKEGKYKAYAWHDENNTLKAEEKGEAYGFFIDTLSLNQNVSGGQFYLSKADLSPFKINRSSPTGQNFDIVLSKFPVDIEVEHEELNINLFYRTNEKTVRLYHRELREDSTAVRLMLIDSVGFKLDTIMYAKFETSERKPEKLEGAIEGPKNFLDTLETKVKFNKPIAYIQYDSLYVKYDSASIIKITNKMLSLKDNVDGTSLTIRVPIADSLKQENYTLVIADSTFQDIEGQYLETKLETNYKKLDKKTLAEEIKVKVNTEHLPLIVQIQNSRGDIIAEQYLVNTNEAIFKYLEAGTYTIRAILDRNNNKRWDTSNMLENRLAEEIYYLENPENQNPRESIIRGGWTMEVTIEPIKPTGLVTSR